MSNIIINPTSMKYILCVVTVSVGQKVAQTKEASSVRLCREKPMISHVWAHGRPKLLFLGHLLNGLSRTTCFILNGFLWMFFLIFGGASGLLGKQINSKFRRFSFQRQAMGVNVFGYDGFQDDAAIRRAAPRFEKSVFFAF